VYDSKGSPTCTKYKHFDWGNERDGWNTPPEDSTGPNQLCFPYDIIEILRGYNDLVVTEKAIIEQELTQ